jgi:KaiC/GvpD/RAD55 family RecA-like ATPase
MDFKKELLDNQTILLIIPGLDYNEDILRVIRNLGNQNIAYVTLNKTSDSLLELFRKNKIKTDRIVFIDAISKTIKNVPNQSEKVYYVTSPGSLTELSLTISKFLSHNFDYLIFDSLTNLLIYENKAPVAKFVSALVNKIRESKTKALFYALSVKEQESLIKESSMFVDKVIDLDK